MSIIYEPAGKAREYSSLACNLYSGCNHGCKYCYAPGIRRMERQNYLVPEARRNIVKDFELDCKKNYNSEKPVLFCFMTDPYNSLESELRLTRECLKIALKHKIPVKILTKSKTVLNDIDIIKKFENHISVGMTITFNDLKKSLEWEPEASIPEDRIKTLNELKNNNVKTWASFEPVIEPEESLIMMDKLKNIVDIFKIGKLNNFQGLDKKIDWNDFLNRSIKILRENNKPFYVKKDLREACPNIKLYGSEILMDDFDPNPF